MNDQHKEITPSATSMTMNEETVIVQGITSDTPTTNRPGSFLPANTIKRDGISESDDEGGFVYGNMMSEDDIPVDEEEEIENVTLSSKRKRTSVNYDLSWEEPDPSARPKRTKSKPTKPAPKMRGVIIGIWRESEQPKDEDKQIIHGFIDDGDRLRFRMHGTNRQHNKTLAIPPGPYGCWVKMQNIILDPHLSGMTHEELKKYVLLESRKDLEEPKQSAGYPQDISDMLKASPNVKDTQASPKSEILLGYWKDSSEKDIKNKHAVFGTVTINDRFRFIVRRSTRDGRDMIGNYPHGGGRYQVQFDKIVLEPNLFKLKRSEIEQYILIRQKQLQDAESNPHKRLHNRHNVKKAIKKAVKVVKAAIALQQLPIATIFGASSTSSASASEPDQDSTSEEEEIKPSKKQPEGHAADVLRRVTTRRKSQHKQVTNGDPDSAIPEDQSASHRKASADRFSKSMEKLNKEWEAQRAAIPREKATSQEAAMLPQSTMTSVSVVNDDVKVHNDVKYTRRHNGLFEGKHVAPPQLLTIDGEDYVEYRVLTKPTMF
ncbi:hypothetical protein SBOR_2856 [Sclerotinia borealis F-4128]|uniref:Uncharacterized protein n=1 Tax=Sclerotinia borealis (strain F-4128) TaxID=1432307 RepID=W9CIX1_SCLBF|nr:hypothetical protein SBOR_2856 [Sclerotinia borealis F-4128]